MCVAIIVGGRMCAVGKLCPILLTPFPHRGISGARPFRPSTSRPPLRAPPKAYGGSRGCSRTVRARATWPLD